MYRSGGFYALEKNSSEFEIAWGVGLDDSSATKKYQIRYTIMDAVKNYNDCSEFYWQFIGTSNGIPANKVTGTIKLPSKVLDKQNLRTWAHGPLQGNINIVDEQTVTFDLENLRAGNMVEVRVVTLENIFNSNLNTISRDGFDNILSQEERWANSANEERNRAKMITAIIVIAIIAEIAVIVFLIVRYFIIISNLKKVEPEEKFDYFRDFPDEDASAGDAAYLYYFDKQRGFKQNVSKVVSGTILSLSLKDAISFEKGEKDKVYIKINENFNIEELKPDEKNVYDILVKVKDSAKTDENNMFEVKDIEKYAKKNYSTFLSKIESIEDIAKKSQIEKGNYDIETDKIAKKWQTKSGIYLAVGFFCFCAMAFIITLFLAIPFFLSAFLCYRIAKKTKQLTQKGANEREKWVALKKYMEEFSLLNEREVPELVLWEKYLVYATAFGIADKVLDQLKIRYPEIVDENYMMSHGYMHLYMINNVNFDRAVASGINRAYSSSLSQRASSNYSSGGGFGGGFSGGGGRSDGRWPDGMGGR